MAPRAQGAVDIAVRRRSDLSVLDGLRQSGSLKCLFPRGAGAAMTGVLLNTAGGLTGGDRLRIGAEAQADSHLVLTTQAAERIYRAQTGQVAHLKTRLRIAAGARLDWLPQETILFDHGALRRILHVEMAASSRLLLVEPLVFGRALMGETVQQAQFNDDIRVVRDGALVFADAVRMHGDLHAQLQGPAVAAGAGAMAGILYVAPDAESRLDRLRALLPATGGASVIRQGVLFARLLAADSFDLRSSMVPMLRYLHGAEIPRTWMI